MPVDAVSVERTVVVPEIAGGVSSTGTVVLADTECFRPFGASAVVVVVVAVVGLGLVVLVLVAVVAVVVVHPGWPG